MCGWIQFLSAGLEDRYESALQVAGVSESTPGSPATKTLTHCTPDLTIISAIMCHPHRAKHTGKKADRQHRKASTCTENITALEPIENVHYMFNHF